MPLPHPRSHAPGCACPPHRPAPPHRSLRRPLPPLRRRLARRHLRPLSTGDRLHEATPTEDPSHARHPALQLPQKPQLPRRRVYPLPQDQHQLAHDQHQLDSRFSWACFGFRRTRTLGLLPSVSPQLTRDQQQLTQDQHQLAQAVHQLAQAVHQVAQAGSVQAAQRASDSHQLLVDSGIALGIVAVLALLAGWLVAGRMLRPIRTITRTARRISSTSLHERLALDGPQDELKELGDTLDDLFARLDAAFEAQRHFVANASHELRTPLTAERTMLQVALDDPHTSAETWRSTAHELLASNGEQAAPDRSPAHPRQQRKRTRPPRTHRPRRHLPHRPSPRPAPTPNASDCTSKPPSAPPRSKATPDSSNVSSPTSSTTPSATTSKAAASKSLPTPQTARPCSRSPTPARSSRPVRSTVSSSHSNASTHAAPTTRTATASDSRSSKPSPPAHNATIDAQAEHDGGFTITVTFPPAANTITPPASTANQGTPEPPIPNLSSSQGKPSTRRTSRA